MKIEILGMGCPKCRKTKENIQAALADLGKEAELAEVKNLKEIVGYGVMMTPAVVIDGQVRLSGRVPSVEQVKSLLEETDE